MFATARPHERYDLYSTPMTTSGRRSQGHRRSPSTSVAMLSWTTVLAFCAAASSVSATPIQADQSLFAKRDGAGAASQNQSLSPKIWIPIVIAIIVFFCIALMTWTKTSWRKTLHLFSFAGSATLPGGGTGTARVLTAEQLAGTINGTGGANATNGNNTARPTRRTRRPRRTPSQMSVTSLPEYNKEPGEEELVIFRGRDMEDATMPTAVAMTSIDEDRSSVSLLLHDNSQVSRYSPMPTSPNNMPLLRDDDVDAAYGDLSLQSLSPEGDDMPRPRRSSDTGSHETSSLMRAEDSNIHLPEATARGSEHEPDARGEAPPYFEVVDLTEIRHNRTDSDGSIGALELQFQSHPTIYSNATTNPTTNTNNTTTTTADTTTATNNNTNANRRSGFRTLLNRMSMVGHSRNESTASNMSTSPAHPRPSTSTSHHSRPSTSMSMFRTLSRQRSTHTLNSPASASATRLTSPSLISLHSISAPLTHTVTRTEFTYPKSGPTAEQLKVISSRESFARFGVPYGADAIAFAASSSRVGLELSGIPDAPPPGFEERETQRAPTPGLGHGPSRLRSESIAGAVRAVEESQEMAQSQSQSPPSIPSSSISPSSSVAFPPTAGDVPGLATPATSADTTPYSSISKSHNPLSSSSPAPLNPNPETAQTTASFTSSNPKHPAPASVSEFGKLSAPPPSSFSYADHTGASASASSARSESRASIFSYQSYATAAESLTPASAQAFFSDADSEVDSDADVGDITSEPSTPRMGGKHVLEMTDATVVPGDRDGGKRLTILASAAGTSGSVGQ